jgi:DNA modification methylase
MPPTEGDEVTAQIIRGDALNLPIADSTVDLVVTSPPYFALRSYQDGGEHYAGQIGSEATPTEFVDALIAATAEMVRVLKPSGSIWVNLGDKYSGAQAQNIGGANRAGDSARTWAQTNPKRTGIPNKSLMGIPWRYALACIDDLGLILRAEVIWSKPNGLPESVTDRVRRSHEQWFHFTKEPRYFSAVDEIREPHAPGSSARAAAGFKANARHDSGNSAGSLRTADLVDGYETNPLGKLAGSVWTVPTEPLRVPDHLGIDHFAAFPTEWPRRIIQGWSPAEVCVECGEGRRPVIRKEHSGDQHPRTPVVVDAPNTGYACACPDTSADTTPAVVLDPFGGTGTTALVAKALGRTGISVDMSADYCRLAQWRTNDPDQLAKAMRVDKPPKQVDGPTGATARRVATERNARQAASDAVESTSRRQHEPSPAPHPEAHPCHDGLQRRCLSQRRPQRVRRLRAPRGVGRMCPLPHQRPVPHRREGQRHHRCHACRLCVRAIRQARTEAARTGEAVQALWPRGVGDMAEAPRLGHVAA